MECKHGQLARSCDVCDLEGEIERMKELIGFANRRADAAEARIAELERAIVKHVAHCGVCGGEGKFIEAGYPEDCPRCGAIRALVRMGGE